MWRWAMVMMLVAGCAKKGLSASSKKGPSASWVKPNAAAQEAFHGLRDGGSALWDAEVQDVLVEHFDINGSGSINTPAEWMAISCDTLQALETSLSRGGTYHVLRQIYGFAPGTIWVGSALGIDEVLRDHADARMAACGLRSPGFTP